MTTAPDHHEPLDDEERALAARLGRIGPFDGPPPALDARILAAAHAAAVTRTPGRRLAWLGVPPALVTGMGVAAAAVLALGLVWQLRPQPGLVTTQGEADTGEEIILIAEPVGAAKAPAVNPPPLPDDAPAAPAGQVQRTVPPATPAPMSQDSAKTVAAPTPAAMADEASALAAQSASAAEEKREAEQPARDAASESGFVAEPSAASAPARKSHATYTTAARALAEQRARAASNVAPPPATAPLVAETAPASAAASAEAGTTLDRIEVTGSRIRADQYSDWSQVPVSDDTHLAAAEWLERVRARRDGDDIDNARASLLLFQREYPRVRLPDDLRELLADAKR
ncbi:hypothetical protein ACFPOA_06345 [Lysobacter niabensis]|uniref:hypothetical protein n=1 Tax=Agrilutibacter niabensis TaxID=380628 RepID=UPI0036093BB2